MSSPQFLTFCVYVFYCLGLYFQLSLFFKNFPPVAFYRCRPILHRALTRLQQGLSRGLVVLLLPGSLTGHKSPHKAEFGFSPQNKFSPPPKGGRGRFLLNLGFFSFSGFVHNWGTLTQQGRFFASLVFPPT